jgi:RNA polymerase sigma factor (sigma-70 family)
MNTNGVPLTSIRMLRAIAADRQSLRWNDFFNRYRPMMLAFLARRFPTLAGEAEDLVQETLLVLVEKLPDYRYDPGELGSFHNYLTGILRNRALRELARRARSGNTAGDFAHALPDVPSDTAGDGEREWRDAVCDIALRQVLSDPTLQERTREVFRRCAVAGESPAAVAEAFGMERNAVDQIKNRLLARMRKIVASLAAADAGD